MHKLRLAGSLAVLAASLILLTAGAAGATPLPLVSSTSFATATNDGYTCVATDAGGVVYAAGYANKNSSGSESRLLLVKYLDDGSSLTRVWHRRVGRGQLRAVAVAVDASGNVVVAANKGTRARGNRGDIVVMKFSRNGGVIWASTYDAPAHGLDYVKALALDARGDAIACGASFGSRTGRDFIALKLTADGRIAWVRRSRRPGNADEARDVTVDEARNVYVTGRTSKRWSASDATNRPCSLLISYGPDGRRRWVRLDDAARMTSGSTVDYRSVEGAGAIFFSGTRRWAEDYGVGLLLRKLRTDGKAEWRWAGEPGAPYAYRPAAAAVDGAGVHVVAGLVDGESGVRAFLSGISADGHDWWDSAFDDPAWSRFASVAVGADGRMLAAGATASGSTSGKDYRPTAFLVRYSAGLPVAAPLDYVGDGGATSRDFCAATAVGDRGMYAVGQTARGDGDSDAVVLKF